MLPTGPPSVYEYLTAYRRSTLPSAAVPRCQRGWSCRKTPEQCNERHGYTIVRVVLSQWGLATLADQSLSFALPPLDLLDLRSRIDDPTGPNPAADLT